MKQMLYIVRSKKVYSIVPTSSRCKNQKTQNRKSPSRVPPTSSGKFLELVSDAILFPELANGANLDHENDVIRNPEQERDESLDPGHARDAIRNPEDASGVNPDPDLGQDTFDVRLILGMVFNNPLKHRIKPFW